ncbi:hypothetical protein BASA81_005383 [Batrachochytrium salamandrivorans]|nr:hypothetical protein BASA81_005383 [Batrachochytrium salamandrivorans]
MESLLVLAHARPKAKSLTGGILDHTWSVAAGVHLGLEEIFRRDLTSSGSLKTQTPSLSQSPKDALQLDAMDPRKLDAAFKAGSHPRLTERKRHALFFHIQPSLLIFFFYLGVTTAVSGFRFKGLAGLTMTARNGSKGLQSNVAGHLQSVKNFKANFSGDTFGAAIKVHDAHNIRRIVQIMGDKDILVGAAEAWKHADKLSGKSVLLLPARCTPSTWGTRECIEPSRVSSSYSIFRNNSVNVCLSIPEDNFSRGLIWEAGWTVSDRHANLSDFEFAQESIGLVSWNIAKAYGFESRTTIRVGGPAHFVVFDNVPGTLKASVRAVVDGDIAECHTEQN